MLELTDFQRKTAAFLPEIELRFAEPMSKHTSFRIGGAAEERENIEHIKLQRQSQRFLPIFFHGGVLLRVFFYYTRAGNAFQERGREVPVDGFAVLCYYFPRNTRKNCGSFR